MDDQSVLYLLTNKLVNDDIIVNKLRNSRGSKKKKPIRDVVFEEDKFNPSPKTKSKHVPMMKPKKVKVRKQSPNKKDKKGRDMQCIIKQIDDTLWNLN